MHLLRVTPDGEVNDYYPWPLTSNNGSNFEIIEGDTLCIIGRSHEGYGKDIRISKAVLDSTGLTPIYDKVYPSQNCGLDLIIWANDYNRNLFDWIRGQAFNAYIRTRALDRYNPATPDKLELVLFDLRSAPNSIPSEKLGPYSWRNYVWRTYEDAWIGWISFFPYEGGGYLLCISDPEDRSITHVLRLDHLGEPIDPTTLDNGGKDNVRKFDKLPSTSESYVQLEIWNEPTYKGIIRDSAQVLFWGCDDEGNLYTYRAVRKF